MPDSTVRGNRLQLTIHQPDKGLLASLTDLDSGRSWGPAPLLALDVFDKPLKRVEQVADWQLVHLETLENGFHVMVADPQRGIEVGLWLRLVDGELVVLLPPAELYERDPVIYRLFAVDLLPGLLRVHNGSLLLPINTGMLCPTAGVPAVHDRFLIYGEQERWELTPTLPFAAAWAADGGMMALARQGACDAECRVDTDGRGGGAVGFAISLRRHWPDPVDMENRELRFLPLPVAEEPVACCARRLRRHIIDDLGKKTLDQRAAESPEVAYLLDAYVMKLFHGVENCGYMMAGQKPLNPGSFQNYMSFAEATACLRKLKQAGVEKILTQCTGWNARGHDGMYPTRFPIDERLGGEAGFREMIRVGNDLGYHMQVHDNFVMQNLNSPDFDRDYAIIDLHGEPLIHGRWAGGPEASGWPLAMPDGRLAGHLRRMQGLGLRGMHYVDYMQQPLEVNYHPKHKGPRAACARGQVLVVETARSVFGACGTEFGFLPCAVAADHISTCGDPWHLTLCKPDWPIVGLIDRQRLVPVWQLAMSGLVALEARGGTSWLNAMTCILLGGVPRDEWSVRPGVMPVLDEARIAALKAVYDLCVGRFGYLKRLQLTSCQRLADDVQHSRFADGTEVTADFARQELLVNGQPVPRPAALAV